MTRLSVHARKEDRHGCQGFAAYHGLDVYQSHPM